MLGVANERELEGDLACGDLGEGLPFRLKVNQLVNFMHTLFISRAGAFDGAISISALQWLCNADKSYHKVFFHFFCFEKHWS